jgi:hypothetical protein
LLPIVTDRPDFPVALSKNNIHGKQRQRVARTVVIGSTIGTRGNGTPFRKAAEIFLEAVVVVSVNGTKYPA